ncbi:FtsX-like permease family protein [Acetobacterium paludosum]|uniref:FtsX-like permease family protein n=1 Tax=Acetobacterium paludosum TaxID=52693 RepID=A0A923HYL4_9FIRM|nr:FtsX-like permease family protein [Acetobacterium paludosum]MBC3888401.1 FtsX-like permease family protein [Acetobacterium paludosum]
MQRVLNKRIFRDLKVNFFRYFALFLLITVGMYLIISLVGAADTVVVNVNEAADRNQVEDGEFTVFIPLEKNTIEQLQNKGISLEKEFYLDYALANGSTVRIYKNRDQINRIELDEGSLAVDKDEIVLEKHYAQKNDFSVGSEIEIGGKLFRVTGIGSSPDYDAALKKMTDSSVESAGFGTGFVSVAQYDQLKENGNASKSEECVYSYRLNGIMTADELKDILGKLKIDRSKVTDTYFLEMLDELEKSKTETQQAISELSDGTNELSSGLIELESNNEELKNGASAIFKQYLQETSKTLSAYGLGTELTEDNYQAILNNIIDGSSNSSTALQTKTALKELNSLKDFKEGIETYTNAEEDAANSSKELADGVSELKNKTEKLMNEYFTVDIDNLTQFVEKGNNPRIGASVNDVMINKYAGMVAGVIIMVLFTYVISVFVIHGIEKDSTIIGTLYALGATSKQLMKHYLTLPVMITFFAGMIGMIIGFSPMGVGVQSVDTTSYYSLPVLNTVYPVYLLLYGIVMPSLVAIIVNYLVINKKLSQPALKMIRNEQKQNKISNVNLGNIKFIQRFQIRQFLREIRTSFTVVFGMFIALLILMMGVDCYVLCNNMSSNSKADTTYEYMYSYKYPTKEVPEGGEASYAESLKKEAYGYDLNVTLLGMDQDNKYFAFNVAKGKNNVTISQSVATKYHLAVGEKLVLTDDVKNIDYAFTIDRIVPYSVGLYVFMDIDDMRQLFNQKEDYYNVVFSDKDLNIDSGKLYATTTKNDIVKNSEVFINQMKPMVISLISVSVIIFVVVMYLMMKVMVDRSAFNISLMKIFGFRQNEIQKLYLDGNFIMVAVSAALCIPLAKKAMDLMYPYLIANVACGMDFSFSWKMYIAIYAGVMLCYLGINRILTGRLQKMKPAEVLKNRE